MSQKHSRGSAGARPALVIDGEAMLVARHPRTKPPGDTSRRATASAEPSNRSADAFDPAYPRTTGGREGPRPVKRRKPPTPDLIFQTAPRQSFALPAEQRLSVLPRSVWIAGLLTLAVLLPMAAASVYGSARNATEVADITPVVAPATPQAKPIRILYGKPTIQPTRIAAAVETRISPLPGTLSGVYPVSAGQHPAGVARLETARNVWSLKTPARRTPTE